MSRSCSAPFSRWRRARDWTVSAAASPIRSPSIWACSTAPIVQNDVKTLPQDARGALRKLGVRFGAYHLSVPALLKPAPRAGGAALGAQARRHRGEGPRRPRPSRCLGAHLDPGRRVDSEGALSRCRLPRLRAACAACRHPRAPGRPDPSAIAFRPGQTPGEPPPGAFMGDAFTVTGAMTSLAGCSGEDFAAVLKALGYRMEKRPPMKDVPIIPVVVSAAAPAAMTAADPAASAAVAAVADPASSSEAEAAEPQGQTGKWSRKNASEETQEAIAAQAAEEPVTEEPVAEAPVVEEAAAAPEQAAASVVGEEPAAIEAIATEPGAPEAMAGRNDAGRSDRAGTGRGLASCALRPRTAAESAQGRRAGRGQARPASPLPEARCSRRWLPGSGRGAAAGPGRPQALAEARPPQDGGGQGGERRFEGRRDERKQDGPREGRPEGRQDGRRDGRQMSAGWPARRPARRGARRTSALQ